MNSQPTSRGAALEQQAQIELFSKLASDSNIDLNQLSNEQIDSLWFSTFGTKIAEDDAACPPGDGGSSPPPFAKKDGEKDEDEDKKKEEEEAKTAAAAEFAAMRTKQAEVEWADHLGRKMAHAFRDELQKEAAAPAAAAPSATKTAAAAPAAFAPQLAALDRLALTEAVKIATAYGVDANEVAARVNSVAVLGLAPSAENSKTASAADVAQAVQLRAFEYLEAAQYQVDWASVGK